MNKTIFCGRIIDGLDREFMIGDSIVSKELEEINCNGKEIHLRYTVSKLPIEPETIEEKTLLTLFGVLDAEHGCIPFSEWTGFVAWDDKFEVGGHSLINELLSFEGQYCYLELWCSGEENE